jgi:hypothetical protein
MIFCKVALQSDRDEKQLDFERWPASEATQVPLALDAEHNRG